MNRWLLLLACRLAEWWLWKVCGLDRREAHRRIQEQLDLYFWRKSQGREP